jgi:hypothetical protein
MIGLGAPRVRAHDRTSTSDQAPVRLMNKEDFDRFLERTAQFHSAVYTHVTTLVPFEGARQVVAFQAGLLSLEHATGAFLLIGEGFLPSAFALMRPQYESLVRGVWLLHAANEQWVEKLAEPLTVESAKRANEGPMLAEMFKQLESAPDSPAHIVDQLKQYRDTAWKALNSYAHGGLHPLSRTLTGYPIQLTYDVLRNSNAVIALTAQLESILSGDPLAMVPVRRIHTEFADCLPILSKG